MMRSLLDRFEFLPHGKDWTTLGAVLLAVVSFTLSVFHFELETHVPGFVALLIVLATTITHVSPRFLIAGSVICLVNSFYACYMFYVLLDFNPCKPGGDDTGDDTQNNSETFSEQKQKYCQERPGELLYNATSAILWAATGLLVLKIPQPGNQYYARGQTAGAMVQSLIEQKVIKMGCCDQFGFFPHGFSRLTLAPVVCTIVAFSLNISQFQLNTHIPAVVALVIVLCTTFTTVTPNVLVGGSVVCFVNAFFEMYFFYIIFWYSSCENNTTTTSNRWLDETTTTSDSVDYDAEFCHDRPGLMEYNAVSAVLWIVTGILVLQIPQPGHYGHYGHQGEQTATFDAVPESVDGFELA